MLALWRSHLAPKLAQICNKISISALVCILAHCTAGNGSAFGQQDCTPIIKVKWPKPELPIRMLGVTTGLMLNQLCFRSLKHSWLCINIWGEHFPSHTSTWPMSTRCRANLHKLMVVCIIIHVLKLFHLLNTQLYYLPPPPFNRSTYELTTGHYNV